MAILSDALLVSVLVGLRGRMVLALKPQRVGPGAWIYAVALGYGNGWWTGCFSHSCNKNMGCGLLVALGPVKSLQFTLIPLA